MLCLLMLFNSSNLGLSEHPLNEDHAMRSIIHKSFCSKLDCPTMDLPTFDYGYELKSFLFNKTVEHLFVLKECLFKLDFPLCKRGRFKLAVYC